MVQAPTRDLEVGRLGVEVPADQLDRLEDPMAQAVRPHLREVPDAVEQPRLRVGVVQQQRVGRDGLDGLADRDQELQAPEVVEESAGSTVLAEDVANAERGRHAVILLPARIPADRDGADDVVGAFEPGAEVGRRVDRVVRAVVIGDQPGEARRLLEADVVEVDQGQLDPAPEEITLQAQVGEEPATEDPASGADERDLHRAIVGVARARGRGPFRRLDVDMR